MIQRIHIVSAISATLVAGSGSASADPRSVDVSIHEPTPPERNVIVELNPVSLIYHKVAASVILASSNHHAGVVSPFYAYTRTEPIYVYDDAGSPTQLPEQKFKGPGIELGYRYYVDENVGPRGMFVGPSLILGAFQATAMSGDRTSYCHFGLAADVGYQSLISDTLSISLGAGLQYTVPTKDIPKQQFPAWIYADGGFLPRVFLNVGVAF